MRINLRQYVKGKGVGADVLPLTFDVRDREAATAAVESLQGNGRLSTC